jgi:hypothetical protein
MNLSANNSSQPIGRCCGTAWRCGTGALPMNHAGQTRTDWLVSN